MNFAQQGQTRDPWRAVAWGVSTTTCVIVVLNVLSTWRQFQCAFVMRATRDWENGQSLYGDLLSYPFTQAAYGWLNYALLRLLRAVTDPETAGRIFTLLGMAMLLGALALAVRKTTGSRLLTTACVGAMAAIPLLVQTRQPDRLAACFEVFAVAVFATSGGLGSAALAGLIGGMGTLGKASAVGALGSFFLAGVALNERRRAWIACAVGAAALLLITVTLHVWSQGNYVRGLIYVAQDDAKAVWSAYSNLAPVLQMSAVPAGLLTIVLFLKGNLSRQVRLIACGVVCCGAVALVGATKVGAGSGYFLTSLCLLILLLGSALSELPAPLQTKLAVGLGIATLAAAVPTRATLSDWKHGIRFDADPVHTDARALLERLPAGPLWSENPRFTCLTDRPVVADDPHSLRRAVEAGRMTMLPVLETLRRRKAAILVLNERPFPQMSSLLFHVQLDETSRQFSCAAWANYEIRGRADGAFFLVPRVTPLAESACRAEDLPWWSSEPSLTEAASQAKACE